jgi:hypothetical protein
MSQLEELQTLRKSSEVKETKSNEFVKELLNNHSSEIANIQGNHELEI